MTPPNPEPAPTEPPQTYDVGGFRLDPAQRLLLGPDGMRVSLPSRAFELLLYFVRHPGELLDKDRLMKAVWPDTVVEENNLNQSVGAIRKAFGDSPADRRVLVTEPGRGYRFVAPVRVAARAGTEFAAVVTAATTAVAAEHTDGSPVAAIRRGWWMWLLPIAMAAVAAVFVWWPRGAPERASTTQVASADRSIAVLPFENHSEERENGYLALGIQDEVLTLLTRASELRVVPRTSTLRYAAGGTPGPQVGRELGVAYLLSGSVQRAGDRVRVNVTLIDAAADRHVWAQSYDRPAADVFAIESEVAQGVAAALQARLTADERRRIAQPPTANPVAYDAYLRARASAERTTRTEGEIRAAIDAYEAAVRADPTFAAAWAQLSRRHANLFSLAYDRSDARRAAALSALGRAEQLAPDAPETLAARGYYMFVVEGDFAESERLFRAHEARAPQSADAAAGLAQLMEERGEYQRADEYTARVLELDPLNPYRHSLICGNYAMTREFERAIRTCGRALELLPGDAGIIAVLATVHQARGEIERAHTLLAGVTRAPGDWRTLRVMSRQWLLERKPRDAVALLERQLAAPDSFATRRGFVTRWLADAQRLAGDRDAARNTYEQAAAQLEAELARQPANPVLMAELATVRGRLGLLEAALRLVPRCVELAERPKRETYRLECEAARIAAELTAGDPARAVAVLGEELTARDMLPPLTGALLELDPEYDALRSRKDFQALLNAPMRGVAESAAK